MYHLFHLCDITHGHMQCMWECRDSFTYEAGGAMGWYLNIPPVFFGRHDAFIYAMYV